MGLLLFCLQAQRPVDHGIAPRSEGIGAEAITRSQTKRRRTRKSKSMHPIAIRQSTNVTSQLRNLLFEARGAKREQGEAHGGKDYDIDHKIVEIGSAQYDCAFEFDVISGG